ncbi:uncharacterized protein LOC105171225 [Sesamum indicum]|uniref:Uncharacterized protein LOC105171225 n=1 Tax=Sesamum indicum TaxID=4182 RepID=A0A6I9TWM4_SESIN|nr:uncharacterized protein LOC105171225 [Sesamum indicum]
MHTKSVRELKLVCSDLPKLAIPQYEDELISCREMEAFEANSIMLRLKHLRKNLEELDKKFKQQAMDGKTTFLNGFVEEDIYMDQPEVSHLLEKSRRYAISKGASMVSNKLPEAGISILMRLYAVMISLRTTLTLVYTRRHGVKLSKRQFPKTDEELRKMFDIPYASAIGSIQYVVQCTRPDVAFALSVTSRYQACAGEPHWTVVKIILKYLRRTTDMFLVYDGGELILEGHSNARFQSDEDDAKSQSGSVFRLNGGIVA